MCQRGPPPVLGAGALSPAALGREAKPSEKRAEEASRGTAAPAREDAAVRAAEVGGWCGGGGVLRVGGRVVAGAAAPGSCFPSVRGLGASESELRPPALAGALREESRAVERDGEARARKKSVGFAVKRGREKGPLGKGPSLASPGQGSLKVRRAACGCAGRLGAGRTSLALRPFWPVRSPGPLTGFAPSSGSRAGRQPLWPLLRLPSCLCPEGPAPRSPGGTAPRVAVKPSEKRAEEASRGTAAPAREDAAVRAAEVGGWCGGGGVLRVGGRVVAGAAAPGSCFPSVRGLGASESELRPPALAGALREESRAVERDGEARARKKSVGFAVKRGREKGPLGKGPSLASPGQGSLKSGGQLAAAPAGLALGGPPCKQGWVLCFAWRWPFAIALLWLPGERGNRPVRRARVPASAPEGGNGALPTPSPPAL
ncbi:elastin-like [Manacus candei]|uniref:elastin-like n=1 Tax=Manacus candei TaxID=415023 RepID=UPI0022271B58|nr:elastin-like [Manacus candei]